MRSVDRAMRTTVQTPPVEVFSVYEGLVLGKASKAFTALRGEDLSEKADSSRPRSVKPEDISWD